MRHPSKQTAKILSFFTAMAMLVTLIAGSGFASDDPPLGYSEEPSLTGAADGVALETTVQNEDQLLAALDSAVYSVIKVNGTITLSDTVEIVRSVTITGGTFKISTKGTEMFLIDAAGETVAFEDVIFDGGSSSSGISVMDGSLTISGCEFNRLRTNGNGAAISISSSADAAIDSSEFFECSAGGDGGAIDNEGELSIRNTTFIRCAAGGEGGGINTVNGSMTDYTGLTFYDCIAQAGNTSVAGMRGTHFENKSSCVITLDVNGGNPLKKAVYWIDQDAFFDASVYEPSYPNNACKFLGWFYKDESGEFIAWSDSIAVTQDITLYASWETLYFSVQYDANEGTVTPEVERVTYGAFPSLPVPIRTGYAFLHWASLEPNTGDLMIWDDSMQVFTDVHLYAQWELAPLTVRYIDSVDGSEIDSVSVANGGEAPKPADPTHAGYTFAEWYADKDLAVPYEFASEVLVDTNIYAGFILNRDGGDGGDGNGGNSGNKDGGGEAVTPPTDNGNNSGGGSDSGGTNTPDDLDGNNQTETPAPGGSGGNSGGSSGGGRTVSVGRDVYINDLDIPLANELLAIFDQEVPLAEINLFDIPDTGFSSHHRLAALFGAAAILLGAMAFKKEN